MPITHAKEFLKSVHNEALFSLLFFRTLIEVRSVNFKAKKLKMAKINSEFLNVSMVEPAPESATTLVSLLKSVYNLAHKPQPPIRPVPKGARYFKNTRGYRKYCSSAKIFRLLCSRFKIMSKNCCEYWYAEII